MRIRLRVPQDGAEKSQGLRGWLRRLFGISDEPEGPLAPEPQPEPEPEPIVDKSRIDRRWTTINEHLAYVPTGRLCVRPNGAWRTEYLFEVFAGGKFRQVRIQIPELALKEWEKTHDLRMPEAGRFRLAKDRLEALLQQGQWPAEQTVEEQSIADLQI
jgi:hypothetical protein